MIGMPAENTLYTRAQLCYETLKFVLRLCISHRNLRAEFGEQICSARRRSLRGLITVTFLPFIFFNARLFLQACNDFSLATFLFFA